MKRAILVTVPADPELYATALASDDPCFISADGDEQHTAILVEADQPSYPGWLPAPEWVPGCTWESGQWVTFHDFGDDGDDYRDWLEMRSDRHQVAFDAGTFVAD